MDLSSSSPARPAPKGRGENGKQTEGMPLAFGERNPGVPYLLNVAYLVLLVLAAPWLLFQAVRKGKYREGFGAKFLGLAPERRSDRFCLWLHAVSVGEVNVLAPLLAEVAGPAVRLQDSATAVAARAGAILDRTGLRNASAGPARYDFHVTDMPHRFEEIGSRFLGRSMDNIHLEKM